MTVGATATAAGGLGIAFRAAGLGFVGHSAAALVVGVVLQAIAFHLAGRGRRDAFTGVRAPAIRSRPPRTSPDAPAASRSQPTPAPASHGERVRVAAHIVAPMALPPGSNATTTPA